MPCKIDKNLAQMFVDVKVIYDHYTHGLSKVCLKYFLDNMDIIRSCYDSFTKISEIQLLAMSKLPGCYVTGRFYKKETVESFYSLCFEGIELRIKALQQNVVPDDYYFENIEMAKHVISLSINGGFSAYENEQELKKLDFSFCKGKLEIVESVALEESEKSIFELYFFMAKPLRRLISFPIEMKGHIIKELRLNDYAISL